MLPCTGHRAERTQMNLGLRGLHRVCGRPAVLAGTGHRAEKTQTRQGRTKVNLGLGGLQVPISASLEDV